MVTASLVFPNDELGMSLFVGAVPPEAVSSGLRLVCVGFLLLRGGGLVGMEMSCTLLCSFYRPAYCFLGVGFAECCACD